MVVRATPERIGDEVRPAERRSAQLQDVDSRRSEEDVCEPCAVGADDEAGTLCRLDLFLGGK